VAFIQYRIVKHSGFRTQITQMRSNADFRGFYC